MQNTSFHSRTTIHILDILIHAVFFHRNFLCKPIFPRTHNKVSLPLPHFFHGPWSSKKPIFCFSSISISSYNFLFRTEFVYFFPSQSSLQYLLLKISICFPNHCKRTPTNFLYCKLFPILVLIYYNLIHLKTSSVGEIMHSKKILKKRNLCRTDKISYLIDATANDKLLT